MNVGSQPELRTGITSLECPLLQSLGPALSFSASHKVEDDEGGISPVQELPQAGRRGHSTLSVFQRMQWDCWPRFSSHTAGPFTGAIFNPALATAATFHCSGNSFWDYIQVYWLGPLAGEIFPGGRSWDGGKAEVLSVTWTALAKG